MDYCLSLMYEASCRIDMGEANSRVHHTQQESGCFGSKCPGVKCGCSLSSRGMLVFLTVTFTRCNVMLEVNPKADGLNVLCIFCLEGFYNIHSLTCFNSYCLLARQQY